MTSRQGLEALANRIERMFAIGICSRDVQDKDCPVLDEVFEHDDQQAIVVALRFAARAGPVEIRPLKWRDHSFVGSELHTASWGDYRIVRDDSCEWPYILRPFIEGQSNYQTLNEAKAAAQTNYEQRICSALVHPAPTSDGALREALESLRRAGEGYYVQYVDQIDAHCRGAGAKLSSRTFGNTDLDAHTKAHEYLGLHRGLMSAVSEINAALVAANQSDGTGLVTATHPDEAAIRADERERCARVAERTPLNSYDAGECRADIAAAIRAGGA